VTGYRAIDEEQRGVNSSLVVSLAQLSPSCRHIAERGELPHFSVKPDSVSQGMRLRQPEGCWVLIAMFVLRTSEFPWTDRPRLAKEWPAAASALHVVDATPIELR
jgi:hypothetical protein